MESDVRVGFLKRVAPEVRNGGQRGISGRDIPKMQRPRNKKEHSMFNGLNGVKNGGRMLVTKG